MRSETPAIRQARSLKRSSTGPTRSKELLAGYRLVDVDSLDRALDIAARSSAAPGPGGVPIQQQIEVRQVMGAPDPEV